MQPLLSIENVSKFYTSAASVVVGLNAVNLSFRRGEFVAITGESGSGKSTLSNVIGGILGYESGEMLFDGKPTSHFDSSDWEHYRRDHISYISQDYGILPGVTVMANVISALRLSGVEKQAANARAREVLEDLELWSLRHRRASRLSSGQKQRLSIARALAKPAPILIADEPTGNLDPENSAKVIALLAKAAQSRLVLIVTHEFSEVKDFATRHIRLQDGVVVMDASLRSVDKPQPLPALPLKSKPKMSLFVSGLQLRSRPVWTALMTLMFTLTAFAVVAFMGTFVVALDDTNTRIYDSSAFINGDPNRIVVIRSDMKPLTKADYEAFAGVQYVTQVERNGYISDAQYAYRDGVDYSTIRTETIFDFGGNVVHEVKTSYDVHSDAPFMQTVPVLPSGQTFLREGRLPESFYEVVAHSSDGFQVGDTVKVFLVNYRYWSRMAKLSFDFTVVGVTDHGSGLYFDDDMGRFCQHVAHTANDARYYQFLPAGDFEYLRESYTNIPAELLPEDLSYELADGEGRIHNSICISKKDDVDSNGILTISVPNVNLGREGKDPVLMSNRVKISTPMEYWVSYTDPLSNKEITRAVGIPRSHGTELFVNLIFVNQNTFDQLCWNEVSEQASLTISHYAYTQQVLDALTELGYVAISPYRLGAVRVDPAKAEQREQTLKVCLLALLAVVVLQIVLLRALFAVETESYRLMRNIGLVRNGAKWSVYWQYLLFTVLGQLLAGFALWFCWNGNIRQVVDIMRYLRPSHLAALSVVHLLAAVTAAFWSARGLQKQVYPVAGRFVDLQMDEEVSV